ncbi:hypothetical protein [Microvirga roseola]|uniref:hypothetical protein n=1 Tax=Microvirga roseola TaxID=2883126 RepID=UPI001E4524BF|nr:hypothetical protein [Microvirga roseola]
MTIDIDQLTEAELIDLNHRIVERLRFLDQMRAHVEMLEFKIGDRVTFQPPGQGPLEGMLTRYNKKTVTVITDTGQRWNVSPTVLSRVKPTKDAKRLGPTWFCCISADTSSDGFDRRSGRFAQRCR